MRASSRAIWALLLASGLAPVGCDEAPERAGGDRAPVAVEAAEVTRGPITRRRRFGGTLEASARLVVTAKVAGRIEALEVDLGDQVERGQVVARLDDDELRQLAAAARAELEVARARARQARGAKDLATRELDRLEALKARGVVSTTQLDQARAEALTQGAAVEVAEAEVARARAALDAARVRLGYARLDAEWRGEDEVRWVAERHAREGDAVRADDPVLTIVALHPLTAVVSAPEADHPFLTPGLEAEIRVTPFPDRVFSARVARVPPAYDPLTRQARVELLVPNPDRELAPGMFAEVSLALETVADATIVPLAALTRRAERPGVFRIVDGRARWVEVEPGLEDGQRVQILSPPLEGRVVTLGQRLLDDGTRVVTPGAPPPSGNGVHPEESPR